MDSLNAVGHPINSNTTETTFALAMNRHLFNVIAHLGSCSRRDAAWTVLVGGAEPEGLQPQVAHARGYGRDRHDTHTSGEGPG
jgi:hypothetical protein